ncbi:hypothetical protein J4E89_008406 [Alternaria sp. Ai002NY15]|nr:hypothetical protein J4E89_008406 [Alternaria sp. Ai002NY15]
MAIVSVNVPPEIYPEVTAFTLWSELVEQQQRVPARSHNSGFNVNDPVWPVNQDTVTARGRVLSAYYGTVPIDMGHAIAGSPDDELSQDHAKFLTNIARNTVQTERYGPKSFIQRFLRGKYSTIEVKTLATNWSLEAIVCQFAVPGEDQAARDIRNANREVYLQGVQDLEQLWEPECQQEKLVPFMNRAKVDRLRTYEGYFTKDMVASHYSTVMNIVDIRRLGENSNIHGIPHL